LPLEIDLAFAEPNVYTGTFSLVREVASPDNVAITRLSKIAVMSMPENVVYVETTLEARLLDAIFYCLHLYYHIMLLERESIIDSLLPV
jgi:hypothetical protein